MVRPRKNKVEAIGSIELVGLPELDIQGVPAKIDTGADNSSIWATDIRLKTGILQFILFAPGSQFYSGNKLSTKEFQTISIKNSFGVTEFRYKVKILVSVGERRIRGWFTLSDRAVMTYPILIGKKFLRKKFLVDVSKVKLHSDQKTRHILVLATNPGAELGEFFEEVHKYIKNTKVTFVIRAYRDIAFSIDKNKVKVIETVTSKDISRFELVYFKSHKNSYPIAISIAQYLRFCNVRFLGKELLNHVSYDKLSEYIRLALHGLPIPQAICGSNEYLKLNAARLANKTGWPLICKEITSDRGRKNYLVANQKELEKILDSAGPDGIYILQAYVPNDGYLRLYVLGSQIPLAIYRKSYDHPNPQKRHLNNPAGSANAQIIPNETVEAGAKDLAMRAAKLMGRQISGVDLIKNTRTGKWFILETNSAPQLRSGSFLPQKREVLAKFIDAELKR